MGDSTGYPWLFTMLHRCFEMSDAYVVHVVRERACVYLHRLYNLESAAFGRHGRAWDEAEGEIKYEEVICRFHNRGVVGRPGAAGV